MRTGQLGGPGQEQREGHGDGQGCVFRMMGGENEPISEVTVLSTERTEHGILGSFISLSGMPV